MLPFFSENFGNASSIHTPGQIARKAVERSRTIIATALHLKKEEVVFTSGATESNNLVTKGIFKALHRRYPQKKLHFITTSIEHHCILDSLKYLEGEFPKEIEVTYLKVNREGLISMKDLEKNIKADTVFISVMYVNNEIGTVEPLKEIGELIRKIRKDRTLPLYFHSDATQAPSYFNCDMDRLGLDSMTLSGHKIYGPKGVGILAIRKKVFLDAIQHGGGHEFKRRSGTLNVSGIVGMGKAMELAEKEREKNVKSVTKLRDYFIKKVKAEIKDSKLNGSIKKRSPNNANFSFPGTEGESVVLSLDREGIAVSTGSACSAEDLRPSHVQLAIGNKALVAHSSIRFTLGKSTTKKDLNYTLKMLKKVIERLRKVSRGIDS